MKNAKLRINDYIYLTYDYRMTIMIREYEICTEHKIHIDCLLRTWSRDRWACLLGKNKSAAYKF